jgi:uncharacterized protein YabN with tetrapyrrole methylase and pyrophosphatase domain
LAGATTRYFGRKYRPELEKGNVEDIKGEIGDLLTLLLGLCDVWGTTPDECLLKTVDKLEWRYDQLQIDKQAKVVTQ